MGLILLALSTSFAAVDWILSLEPTFWSSVFPMTAGAAWFNTGLAFVILVIAVAGRTAARRGHITDLVTILLATTILWAYLEFVQFLIIWEENLKTEIPWYLLRMGGMWKEVLFVAAGLGFFVPFFALLTAPGKRSLIVVRIVCVLILIGMIAQKWWLVLPQFSGTGPFWLNLAAILALGGLMLLVFLAALGAQGRLTASWPRVAPGHG